MSNQSALFPSLNDGTELFPQRIQTKLNIFVLFLAFPAFAMLGNSITFYLFLDLMFCLGIQKNYNFKGRFLFYAFFAVGVISSFLTPVSDSHPGVFSIVLLQIQFLYWIAIASFAIRNIRRIDFYQLSKWMLIGTVIYVVLFFVFPLNFKSPVFSIEFEPGRNALVFNLLCSIPLSMYYVLKRWGKKGILGAIFFFMVVMMMTKGRAGAIIYLIQAFLILGIIYYSIQKYFRLVVIVLLLGYGYAQTTTGQMQMQIFSYKVDQVNPRLGSLLRTGDDDPLKRDKSWLQRKLLIEKGKEIFLKYPFLGIGPNQFKYYKAELEAYAKFDYLQGINKATHNRRSAHNSYIQVLTEYGFIGFIIFASILLAPMFLFGRKLYRAKLTWEYLPLVSLIGISIHFYAISAFTGAIPWLIFGLSWAMVNENRKNKAA